jgi:flagellar biosynthesis chaperone FliJ
MKGLDSLIRVHKWKLDEKRRELVDFENLRASFVKQLRSLEEQHQQEQTVAGDDPEIGFSFANYAAVAQQQQENIQASIDEVDAKITVLNDEVTACFQELKKYQVALEAREIKAKYERNRIEQMRLDELAIDLHRRKGGM